MKRLIPSLIILALLLGLTPLAARAAGSAPVPTVYEAGEVDTTFGTDGEVYTEILAGEDHWGPKMVLQDDDRLVVAGECGDAEEFFCVLRYNSDGSLDSSFGGKGYVKTDIISGEDDSARDLALQDDGKILVIGDCDDPQRICIVRYNKDGTLDSSFGHGNGYVVFDYVLDDEGESLAVQPNGRIVVAGECNFDNYLCVSRRLGNGGWDYSFNNDTGLAFINPTSGADDEDPEVALDADGRIVIAASCDDREDVCVARFNKDGTLDNDFGDAGVNWTRTPVANGNNYVQEVRITDSGRILVAGECDDIRYFCVLAYDDDGQLDTTFGGGDGIVLTTFLNQHWAGGYGMILQDDGKILVSGTCTDIGIFCLVRYRADGSLDFDFGEEGQTTHDFTGEGDYGKDVVVQSDGKIVMSGTCRDDAQFCLTRFYGDDVPFYTGISGDTYYFDGGYIYIPPGAVPSGEDADIDRCILNVERAGPAGSYGVSLDEDVWNITVECDGKLVHFFQQDLTICLAPKEDSTIGKQLYSRQEGNDLWDPLPLHAVKAGMVCGTTNHLSLFLVGEPGLPSTGFAPGALSDLPEQPAAAAYAASDMMLNIAKLGVSLDIVGVPQSPTGWDVTWLGNEAGYLYGSAYPTWAGNTVLTAHVWDADNQPGPFYGLKELQHGDQITISAYGQTYVYEVRAISLLPAGQAPSFAHSDYDLLTLITCESFDESSGDYLYRRVVSAVLIAVQ